MPEAMQSRGISAVSTIAWALMNHADQLEAIAGQIAPQAQLDEGLVLRAARRVSEQIQTAQEHGR
jgi:hypothetical protein